MAGYGDPPKHTRFKPGNRPHNAGVRSTAAEKVDVTDFFSQPVKVPGKTRKMDPFEVELTNLGLAAGQGDMAAAAEFLKICARYAVVGGPPDAEWQHFGTIPLEWDAVEWTAKFNELGFPPWPGERDGLVPLHRRKEPFRGR